MNLVKANPTAKVTGEGEMSGKKNYFIGDDPRKWRNNVSTYAKVRYEGVYPGIDLVYYGNQQQLEYDFVVAPGADAHCIRFDVLGAKYIRLDSHGDLVLRMGNGKVRLNRPFAYQEKNETRQRVGARYVIQSKRSVSFDLASYDSHTPLIIDPALNYATYLGGSGYDSGTSIVVGRSGNVYVAGTTTSINFPTTIGAFQTNCKTSCTYDEAFVTEFNPSGSALVYSTYLGGSGNGSNAGDGASAIVVDASGNVYVTGHTASSDFPTTPGAFQTACKASCTYGEGFVSKLDPTGSALVYSTYLGGSGNSTSGDVATAIVVDGSGDAYVTGNTRSSDFPTTSGAFQTSCSSLNNECSFITELNPMGSAPVYSTYLGGIGEANSIAVDSLGNAYVAGVARTSGTMCRTSPEACFPTTPGAFQTNCVANCTNGEMFVTELNSTGAALKYSTYLGGSGNTGGQGDAASAIVVDSSGNSYVTGYTASSDFPTTPGAFQTACLSVSTIRAFVMELNPTGSALIYSTYLGGAQHAETVSDAIALDSSGNVYVTGTVNGNGILPTPGAFQPSYGAKGSIGAPDIFLAKFVLGDQVWPVLLSFGNQTAGRTGQSQVTTLTNSESSALSITSIGVNGADSSDFQETNNCGTSLPPGSSCKINVAFTPTALGARIAAVNVNDTAANSPQAVALSGTGTSTVTLAPQSLTFGNQPLGISSSPLVSTLTNVGNADLTVTSVAIIGAGSSEFAQTNNCPNSIPPNSSCTVNVTFTPLASGNANASLAVTDGALDSPQTVALTGIGTGAVVTLSPLSITFPNQYVGTSGLPQTVTVTNTGNAALTITNVTTNPVDFGTLNACGSTVAAGSSCSIGVFFDPTASGTRTGTLTINDNGPGSPQTVALGGTGQVS